MVLAQEIHETVLANGLKILVVEDHSSATASLQLFYRVGSRNEREGITGISHVFEHMMFKGTARYPEGAFDRIVQDNGMAYNAYTNHDFTCYYENLASDRLGVAMELEADRMQGLLLDEGTFQREMSVIREERRETVEDTPFGSLSEKVQAAVFAVHPYRWPIIGWMSDLESISLADVRAYYRDFYRPNNAVLVAVGDLDAGAAADLAGRHFGPAGRGSDLALQPTEEPPQREEREVTVFKEVQLPGFLICYRTPASHTRAAKALNVIEFLLLHGRSSRLYQKLIYREQLATGLSGGLSLRAEPGVFGFRAMARPGVALETVQAGLDQALEDLVLHPVSEGELAKVRNAIEADFVFSQESHFGLGQNLGQDECRSSWRTTLTWMADHLTVTAEEIQETAAATFSRDNRTVGRLFPAAGKTGPREGEA